MKLTGIVIAFVGLGLFLVGIIGLAITDGPEPPLYVDTPTLLQIVSDAVDWFFNQAGAAITGILDTGVNGWRRLLQGGLFLLFLGMIIWIIATITVAVSGGNGADTSAPDPNAASEQ